MWYSYYKDNHQTDIAGYESSGIYEIHVYTYIDLSEYEESTPVTPPVNTKYSTLYFNNTSNRTEFSGVKQVWTNGVITLTNAGSCGDYVSPVRLYANSNVEISGTNITKIVFSCASSSDTYTYAEKLYDSLEGYNAATVYMSNDTVVIEFTNPTNLVEFNIIKQTRLLNVTVYFE